MSKKDDLLDNNDDKQKTTKPRQPRKKPTEQPGAMKATKKTTKVAVEDPYLNPDEIINVELYNEILSTLYNSLNNPIVRNEIKVNETILKYLELQISNLFFLESALSKELTGHKMAKEFLQLTANIMDLALSISKSPKKTRIDILEDRNLLVVTIVNSCKGVERESLERVRLVDTAALQSLSDQISALSDFTSEEKTPVTEDTDYKQEEDTEEDRTSQTANNQLNNQNMRDLNVNMANLTKMGMLPEHPMAKPNFYPYLTKPQVIPLLKKILAGLLIASSVLVLITIVLSLYVKGELTFDTTKDPIAFTLSQTNNWLILIMTIVLYASFAYMFLRPARVVREKYRISYFILGLLFFWLIVTMTYYFWQVSDGYYKNIFESALANVPKENRPADGAAGLVEALKGFPNFSIFKIFAMIAGGFSVLPLLIVLVLILINPRVDRKKLMRANIEYQNAINAALNGKKYDMDPTLFDHEEPSDKKRKKANFSGRF